jgi:hypothetical protein
MNELQDDDLRRAFRSMARQEPITSATPAEEIRHIGDRRVRRRRITIGSTLGAAAIAAIAFAAVDRAGSHATHEITVSGVPSARSVPPIRSSNSPLQRPSSTSYPNSASTIEGEQAVPNVVGQSATAAESALSDQGFEVSSTMTSSLIVPAGNVVSQTPKAGSMAEKGSEIKLVVSAGPPSNG